MYTVLVVDDSPDSLSLINDILEKEGISTLVALEGSQAITIAEQIKPDIILLDAMMPKLDGFETCTRLKQNRELQQIFGVRGYPTVWLVTPQIIKSDDPANPGDKINFLKLGSLGYVAGGPEKWINAADSFLINE